MGWIKLIQQAAKTIAQRSQKSKKTAKPKKEIDEENSRKIQSEKPSKQTSEINDDARKKALEEGKKLKEKGASTEDKYSTLGRNDNSDDAVNYRAREITEEKPPYDPVQVQPTPQGKSQNKGREL